MRYYDLQILPANGGAAVRHWTSHPNGPQSAPDPGALNVEFDLVIMPFAQASGGSGSADYSTSFIRVWGIPIADISQASNLSAPTNDIFTYKAILKGGMGKGLPLANPAQIDTLVQGSVWRAIGNWVGTSMTLDLYISSPKAPTAPSYSNTNVARSPINNFTFDWKQGKPIATAIAATLKAAYPEIQVLIDVSSALVKGNDEFGIYGTVQEFTNYIQSVTKSVLGPGDPTYQGVTIAPRDGGVVAYDSKGGDNGGAKTPQYKTVNISFLDLIGQPTWLDNQIIQVTTVMRGDIQINDTITMPVTLTTVSPAGINKSNSGTFNQARFSSQFQGNWQVRTVRQVGNYKQPHATSWVTVIEAINNKGVNGTVNLASQSTQNTPGA